MKTNLYYCNINNFGDKLNEFIFKEILNIDINFSEISDASVIGIGSLLDMILMDSKNNNKFNKKELKVFSTGFGFESGDFFHNKHIIFPEKFVRNLKVYTLRGKLTKQRFINMGHDVSEVVLGDAGLLTSVLIDKNQIKKKYKLGIVPHFADKDNPIFKQIQANVQDSIILDVTNDPIEFLKLLCQCETVISTAMHPLIACDSLAIPNQWVRISENTTSRYKFHDYYSVFDNKAGVEPLNLLEVNFTQDHVREIVDNYDISEEQIREIKRNLLRAMVKLKRDLKKEILFKSIIYCLNFLFNVSNVYHGDKKHKVFSFCGLKIKVKCN